MENILIKDKDNMLQIVKLDSQNGVILRVNDKNSNKENDKQHGDKRGYGEN